MIRCTSSPSVSQGQRNAGSLLGKSRLARLMVCAMLLLVVPSCWIPALRQAEPGPDLASLDGAADAANSAHLSIAEFFNDPLLICLIDQALANNRELKILNEEVQIADNDVLARRGAYWPFVTFGTSVGVDKPSLFTPLGAAEEQLEYLPGKHFPDPLPNFQMGFNIFWPLDVWREYRNGRDAAIQRFYAANERRNFFVTKLVAEIAENYYGLMALDQRQQTLDKTIELQEQSLKISIEKKNAGRGTELAVQRFQAEVRKNQSEKLIVKQDIIEVENRINFLVNRFPQPVERQSAVFFDLTIHALAVGVPPQLLQNRPDIRQAEREVEAAGLDVQVARAHFFPKLDLVAGVGYQAFSPKYLFWTPDALIYNAACNLVVPVLNRKAIKAEYMNANARQLESIYNYQRTTLTAFTEVVNRMSMVENYSKSIEIKKRQLEALVASVESASDLFQNARAEYVEVLLAQRDLMDARMVLIDTKRQQLAAIVNTYQALGGGDVLTRAAQAQHADASGQPCPPQQLPAAGKEAAPAPPADLPAPRKEKDAP